MAAYYCLVGVEGAEVAGVGIAVQGQTDGGFEGHTGVRIETDWVGVEACLGSLGVEAGAVLVVSCGPYLGVGEGESPLGWADADLEGGAVTAHQVSSA